MRVTVLVQGVPQEAANNRSPFVLFALLQHEHKKSVLNFTVQRNTEYDGPVRSKVHFSLFLVLVSLLTLQRILSFSVSVRVDCESILSTANILVAEEKALIMSTNSRDSSDMV
jgi:hypothetical protein